MRLASFAVFASLLLALCACGARPGALGVLQLPSGERYDLLGVGPFVIVGAGRALMVRYVSHVDVTNAGAVQAEAQAIFPIAVLEAERQGLPSLILSASSPPSGAFFTTSRQFNVVYERNDGVWSHRGAPVPQLQGRMTAYRWLPGSWQCGVSLATDKFSTVYVGKQVDWVAPGGTAIEESFVLYAPPGDQYLVSRYAYDAARSVWTTVTRSARSEERLLAVGPYSRTMTYRVVSAAQNTGDLQGKQRETVDAAGVRLQIESEQRTRAGWQTTNRVTCTKDK